MNVEPNPASNPANESPEKDKIAGLSSTPANKSPDNTTAPAKKLPDEDKVAALASNQVNKPPEGDAIKLPPSLAAKDDVPIKSPLPRLETSSEETAATGEEAPALPSHLRNIMFPTADPGSVVSGGGISFLTGNRNAKFSYGYSSFKGKRSSMEDFYEASISEVDGQMVACFGVFDGHGGSRTAEYLKNNLFKNLSSHPDFIKDTKSAIVESFRQTDVDYLNEEKTQQKDAGSTAAAAVLVGDRLLVANVGDSRVVASRAGTAIPLSIDHKPDRSDERERIEQAGGFIIWAGTWRVGGVLAVSRAFGDKLLKPYVVADPEIQEEEIEGFDFLIIASDGLWNVFSNMVSISLNHEFEVDTFGFHDT
ncbi:hypothetical protein AgCh_026195 [Apium graveolens]